MKIKILFIALIFSLNATAQNLPLFKNGDRVCFVGNSITNAGEFHHNIYQYYVTRYPKNDISFFNCGISGDQTGGILKRFDSDVMSHQPTHAIIMIGMNDVNRSLYSVVPTTNQDTLQKRLAVLVTYKKNLDSIVRKFLDKGVKVLLQKPSIYDQTGVQERENNFGVNDALKNCADFMESLAKKYKLTTIDYWTTMTILNKQMQAKDPKATIIGKDRVHPGSTGHMVMAYQFLTDTKAEKYVAKIGVKADKASSNAASRNCAFSKLKQTKDSLWCSVLENALPFPVSEGQQEAMGLVPFVNNFNVELLTFPNLAKGKYQLKIDSVVVGIFDQDSLKLGINLANYSNTPQYQQALAVRKSLFDLWKKESELRTIRYVEFKFLQDYAHKANMDSVKNYLDDLFKRKLSNTPLSKTQFDKYYDLKGKQPQMEIDYAAFHKQSYQLSQPKAHLFLLTKQNKN